MTTACKKDLPIAQVAIGDIKIDGGTQPRVKINNATVNEYADKLDELDPAHVFFDGVNYWLADGFHRYHAHRKKNRGTMNCYRHIGTVRDAILFAVGANAENPLQLNDDDRRHSCRMLLGDKEWGKWSNEEVARQCRVSPWMVGDERRKLKEEAKERREREKAAAERAKEKAQQEAEAKAAAERAKLKEGWVRPGKKTEAGVAAAESASLRNAEIAEEEGAEERIVHRNGKTYTMKTDKIGKGRDRNTVRLERDADKQKELDAQIKRSRKKYVRQCLKRGMTEEEIIADVRKEIAETPVAS